MEGSGGVRGVDSISGGEEGEEEVEVEGVWRRGRR